MEQVTIQSNSPASLVPSLPLCCHIYPKGRRCRRQIGRAGELYCYLHLRQLPDPHSELIHELNGSSGANEVRSFISKVIRLACQNRISMSRATALTFMANSLLNAIRLANHEERLAAKAEPEELKIDWTGIPRPAYESRAMEQEIVTR